MSEFDWKALDAQGKVRKGSSTALDLATLEGRLSQEGLLLIRVRKSRKSWFAQSMGKGGLLSLVNFSFQSAMMMRAGVPLIEALQTVCQAENHPGFKQALNQVIDALGSGRNFSESLASQPRCFNEIYINLIRAGEQTGQLPEVLEKLTETLKWQYEMHQQIKKALLYPVIVLIVVLGVLLFMLTYVVPQIVGLLETLRIELPWPTRFLIASSRFITQHSLGLVLTALCLGLCLLSLHRLPLAWRRRLHRFMLRVPVCGQVIRSIAIAQFAYVFSLLYAAGITVIDALSIVERSVGNLAVAQAIGHARTLISQGQSLSQAFSQSGKDGDLFPALAMSMLRVGETTGRLDTALNNVSQFYTREARELMDNLQTLLQPALTVVLGGLLAAVMAFTLGPLYSSVMGNVKL
jgi:type IV pilus assembly protein PilC